MRGQELGAVALGLGLGGFGGGDRLVHVGVGHQPRLELHVRDVGQLAVDPGGLQRVLQLQRQAAGLEQRAGDIGDQGGARRLIGEGGGVEVGIRPALAGGAAAPEVEFPADVEVGVEALGSAGRGEDAAERAGAAQYRRLGAGGGPLQASLGNVELVEGLGADCRGLIQHGDGGPGVGGVLQRLVDQGVELRIAVKRPPVVQRRGSEAVRIGLGRLIGRRRRHLGLADRGGHAAGRQQRSCRDQQDTFHADTEPDRSPAGTRLDVPEAPIWQWQRRGKRPSVALAQHVDAVKRALHCNIDDVIPQRLMNFSDDKF